MIVRGARLLDVGLQQIAVLRHVTSAGFDPAEHLGPFALRFAQLEHADFVRVADLLEDDREISKELQADGLDGQRYLTCCHLRFGRDECAWHELAGFVVEGRPRDDGLVRCRLQLDALDIARDCVFALRRLMLTGTPTRT